MVHGVNLYFKGYFSLNTFPWSQDILSYTNLYCIPQNLDKMRETTRISKGMLTEYLHYKNGSSYSSSKGNAISKVYCYEKWQVDTTRYVVQCVKHTQDVGHSPIVVDPEFPKGVLRLQWSRSRKEEIKHNLSREVRGHLPTENFWKFSLLRLNLLTILAFTLWAASWSSICNSGNTNLKVSCKG